MPTTTVANTRAKQGAAATKRCDTRKKMLISAAAVMRERGAEVLTRSGAPRGSVYYHFPEGRSQILTEALRYAGDAITAGIDDTADRGAMVLLRGFVEFWEQQLTESDFNAGCPVVAAAIGCPGEEPHLTTEAGQIIGRWRAALMRAFVADGFDEPDAASLAVMSIAALEGAVVLCRSTQCTDPLRDVHGQLEFLIKAREFVRRQGLPGHK